MARKTKATSKPVRSIQILVFPDSTPIVPVGLLDLLRKTEALAASMGIDRQVDVQLVSASRKLTVRAAAGLPIRCDATLGDAPRADMIIVTPVDPEVLDKHSQRPELARFLEKAHRRGANVASVCTGAFALAEAGLLDGRPAATHWAFQELFASRYPKVDLRPQEILIDSGGILTTGGATSFLNLALYLAERLYGPEVSRAASKMFLIDPQKSPQGAYAAFAGQKQHGDSEILSAQEWLERKGTEPIRVEEAAAHVSMSPRTFIRRFKAAAGSTPLEYLQRVRVEAAKRLLESTREPVTTVAAKVGYADPPAFRRLFQRYTGLTPNEYRKRYGRQPLS